MIASCWLATLMEVDATRVPTRAVTVNVPGVVATYCPLELMLPPDVVQFAAGDVTLAPNWSVSAAYSPSSPACCAWWSPFSGCCEVNPSN